MKSTVLFGLSAAYCLAVSAIAQDSLPDHSLSDFKLGDHISGDEVDLSNLEGRVVAIEWWGTR